MAWFGVSVCPEVFMSDRDSSKDWETALPLGELGVCLTEVQDPALCDERDSRALFQGRMSSIDCY